MFSAVIRYLIPWPFSRKQQSKKSSKTAEEWKCVIRYLFENVISDIVDTRNGVCIDDLVIGKVYRMGKCGLDHAIRVADRRSIMNLRCVNNMLSDCVLEQMSLHRDTTHVMIEEFIITKIANRLRRLHKLDDHFLLWSHRKLTRYHPWDKVVACFHWVSFAFCMCLTCFILPVEQLVLKILFLGIGWYIVRTWILTTFFVQKIYFYCYPLMYELGLWCGAVGIERVIGSPPKFVQSTIPKPLLRDLYVRILRMVEDERY